MQEVRPEVRLIARPEVDWLEVEKYLKAVDGLEWYDRVRGQDRLDGEDLIEFSARGCYRSWKPGLNKNIAKVREDSKEYLENLLANKHGSTLEHANYTFVISGVSRVFTHELVRHRAGTAISQESLRFVRLDDLPFWFPEWARDDEELVERAVALLLYMEDFQRWMAGHFGLDDDGVPFSEKKSKTSFMRRFAPEGVATMMTWTSNIRALRWIIQQRTEPGAEEEIRLVFDQVAKIMVDECPVLFGDFVRQDDGSWVTEYRKV